MLDVALAPFLCLCGAGRAVAGRGQPRCARPEALRSRAAPGGPQGQRRLRALSPAGTARRGSAPLTRSDKPAALSKDTHRDFST